MHTLLFKKLVTVTGIVLPWCMQIITGTHKDGNHGILVEDEDYEWLNSYKWSIRKQHGNMYAESWALGSMHRAIMKTPKGMVTDHKDRNGLNNLRDNLRICTHSENSQNRRPGGKTSKYLGVSLHRCKHKYVSRKTGQTTLRIREYWIAKIIINKKQRNLGLFKYEKDAARAYDQYAEICHGEFANLNFKS